MDRRRFGRIALLMALVMSSVVPASAQTSELRATEGEWSGLVSFVGGGIPFRGSFAFTSASGELEGGFQWSGGTVAAAGVVGGPDTMPRFELTSVVSAGINVPDVSGGGDIEFTAASCERLEGTGVNIDVAQMVDIGSIVWWAVRADAMSDPAAFFDALDGLRTEVGELMDSIERGAIILGGGLTGRLNPLLAEANRLASQLDRSESCGEEFYRSVVASEVERLLLFALASPDINAFYLGEILMIAVGSGVIGSGSEADTSILDTAAYDAFGERIVAAIEAGDFEALSILALVADTMGWEDLEALALEAYEAG